MLDIIDEQNGFIVINKQAGVSLHNEQRNGLIHAIRRERCSDAIYPVHRLDKATSGLLLLATKPSSNRDLSLLFQRRKIEKYYLAISNTKPAKKQGLILGDMERTRSGNWKLTRNKHNPAITQFFSVGLVDGARLFILKPATGKTHQLRVAMKSLGSPIVGDLRYSHDTVSPRMLLHAYSLRFHLNGCDYSYVCPPDSDSFPQSALFWLEQQENSPWDMPWPPLPNGIQK